MGSRRRFTREFKEGAVRRMEMGVPVAEVGRQARSEVFQVPVPPVAVEPSPSWSHHIAEWPIVSPRMPARSVTSSKVPSPRLWKR